jgi:hypothetical protein
MEPGMRTPTVTMDRARIATVNDTDMITSVGAAGTSAAAAAAAASSAACALRCARHCTRAAAATEAGAFI